MTRLKTYLPLIITIVVLIGWAIFFYYVSPTVIVDYIGVKNAYLVAFILAVICGFSSLTGSTFYVALAALSHGGANPIILGLVGGIGLCISDYAFYFVASKGTSVIDTHWKKTTAFIRTWIYRVPDWLLYTIVFVYSAFAPIPNDVMLVALTLSDRPFKKFGPYLFAGDIASTLLLAYITK